MKSCKNCKFFAKVDSGYSNWTVTETDIHCMKCHFDPVEESYSWIYEGGNQPELFEKANECQDYRDIEGVQVHLDVDGEVTIEDCRDDTEVYAAARIYFRHRVE